MAVKVRDYRGDEDFVKIRDFLVETFSLWGRPVNWMIDRWNFCRYFGLPLHTFYNTRYYGVPALPRQSHRDEVPVWESSIGIWEDDTGRILGVVHTENEEPGEVWLELHPDHLDLQDEMVAYAEAHLADHAEGWRFVKLLVSEGCGLERVASGRGYRKLDGGQAYLEYTIEEPAEPVLPGGYTIRSVADEDDVEKRRIVRAFSFGAFSGPSDWSPASAFTEMQRAPDYRADLDLFVVAPEGEYASFCTIWLDERNGSGNFVPVGTHVDHQRRGLARALLQEGFRRLEALGASRSFMASGNPFYKKVGFVETPYAYSPWVKYWRV